MRLKKYSCPNGCKLPPRRKVLRPLDNHTFGFVYDDFLYCPVCGEMMPCTLDKVRDFFKIYHIHPKLQKAERLIYKSEYESAAREAFVVVETALKEKTGKDLHGKELVVEALKYEYDRKTGELKKPCIAINNLTTESERNEQEGIKMMLIGYFQGMRNLYQHNHIGATVSYSITVVLNASLFLNLLDGHSFTQKGKWQKEVFNYKDVFEHTPKMFDRFRLAYLMRKKKYLQVSRKKKRYRRKKPMGRN